MATKDEITAATLPVNNDAPASTRLGTPAQTFFGDQSRISSMSKKKPKEIYVPLYEVRWPNALRWHGSVLPAVLPKVIFFTLYGTLITVIDVLGIANLGIANSLISILGLVVGLLLVFRTNTAYDRFYEGRRLWSGMIISIRNLTRFCWMGVKGTEPRDIIEKKSAINLLVAFAVATKHYLREEYGINYEDLYDFIAHIPKYSIPSSVVPLEGGEETDTQGKKSRMHHHSVAVTRASTSNLPLEISIYISSYVQKQAKIGKIDPPVMTIIIAQLNSLVDCLTGFERILRTPIPLAYSIHLSQTVWMYCLALPFQLVDALGWVTIPMMAISCFTLFGIESIGGEIENPFGYDTNDLPLDDFCDVIKKEQDMITSIPPPTVENWVGSMGDPAATAAAANSAPQTNPVKEAEAALRKEREANGGR